MLLRAFDITNAIEVMVKQTRKYHQKNHYVSIVDHCLANNNIDGAKIVIPLIEDQYTQNEH